MFSYAFRISPGSKLSPGRLRLSAFVLFFCLFVQQKTNAQCLPLPPADVTCMTGTAVSSGSNINSGTYVHCSSSGSYSNVNVSGGTLQVCGDLTINNLTFNSGTIAISQYGHLRVNGSITLNNNCTIVNYGTLNVSGNLVFQNSNNYVYNARTDASIIVTGNISFPVNTNQYSYLLNKGYISAGTFTLSDGCTTVCMENGSYLGVTNFNLSINNINNPITYGSPTGSALIRYSNSANLGSNAAKSVTSYSAIVVCKASGATLSGSGSWGSATLTTGCSANSIPTQTGFVSTCYTLPVEWMSFTGEAKGAQISLNWKTATEQNNDHFDIEMNRGTGDFETIGRVNGSGTSSQPHSYSFEWTAPAGDYYFRLKQVDYNGKYDYSVSLYVHVAANGEVAYASANPFAEMLQINASGQAETLLLTMYNSLGQIALRSELTNGMNTIGTGQLPAGTYTAVISTMNGQELRHDLLLKVQR